MQKAIQSRLLTLLSTRTGASIFLIGIIACIYMCLSIFDGVIDSINLSINPSSSQSIHRSLSTDNLHGRSFDSELLALPVDIIYTWVNGSDERLVEQLKHFQAALDNDAMIALSHQPSDQPVDQTIDQLLNDFNQTGKSSNQTINQNNPTVIVNQSLAESLDHVTANRFRDNSELLYSLRSVYQHAGWVRHIYLVTNGQVPHWLNLNHPRLTVIQHSDIFPNKSHLPTFSSPAIESHLHRIPGLSRYSIYFNDDVMLGSDVTPEDWYGVNGHKVYLSWNVPHCSQGCPDTWVTDGYCDAACNNAACEWDGGDCANTTSGTETRISTWEKGARRNEKSGSLNTARYCASGCPNNWIGDKVCDRSCKNDACAYDGGDCGLELLEENILGLQLEPLNQSTNQSNDQRIVFDLPYDQRTLYINLTAMFPGTITIASHNNPDLVRSAIVTQAIKTLVFILFAEEDFDSVDLAEFHSINNQTNNSTINQSSELPHHNIEVFLAGEHEGALFNVTFNVTRSRVPPQPSATRRLLSINPTVDQSIDDSWFESAADWRDVPDVLVDQSIYHSLDHLADHLPLAASSTDNTSSTRIVINQSSKQTPNQLHHHTVQKKKHIWLEAQQRQQDQAVQLVQSAVKLKQHTWDQSNEQSFDHLINQSVDQPINQSITHSTFNSLWPWEFGSDATQWSRTWGVVDEIAESINEHSSNVLNAFVDLIKNSKDTINRSHRRRLLDSYGSSLRHVNKLLHGLYGKEVRKAPAHMPHWMDKEIMLELQAQWPTHYEETSSNRFRTSKDMQHAFAYFYYVIHARATFNITQVWSSRLDSNGNGKLDEREIKSLALYVADTVLTRDEIGAVKEMLVNCSYATYPNQAIKQSIDQSTDLPNEHSSDSSSALSLPLIDINVLSQCTDILPALTERVVSQPKYKHRIESLQEVEFFMVPDNATVVTRRLDQITMKRPKFICLNDNMNKTSSQSPTDTLALLHEFYQTYFPTPSPFELPQGQPNGYRYIDEWRADHGNQLNIQSYYQSNNQTISWATLLFVLVGCFVLLIGIWSMWPNKKSTKQSQLRSKSMNRRGVTTSTIV